MNNDGLDQSAGGQPARTRFSLARFLDFQELSPEERRSVLEDLFVFGKTNQTPYLVRQAVLLVLSTVIATAGLISDSAAVVIGAMLVAPMMNPVLAAAGAVVMGWSRRFSNALWLVAGMALGALLISSLLTLISPELVILPEQVLARTRPTYWDLLIALAAGSAGAYTITRKESSAIPGVAVAVALLPPLASAGILFTSALPELGLRAVVLFLTNLVAMVLAGALTFLAVGVSPAASRRRSSSFIITKLSLFALLTVAVCVPLYFYSDKVLFNAHYLAARSEVLQQWLRENELELVDVDIKGERSQLVLVLAGPTPPINIGELHQAIVDTHELENPDRFTIDYTWTAKQSGSWPTQKSELDEVAARVRESATLMFSRQWRWVGTDIDRGQSTVPGAGEDIVVVFQPNGKVQINAPCGRRTGKVAWSRQELEIDMNRGFMSKCRNDVALNVFLSDFQLAREWVLQGSSLRLRLRGDTAVMNFSEQK